MKKTTEKLLKCVAVVSKKSSSVWANFPCVFWDYQPKTPKIVKKLRKF